VTAVLVFTSGETLGTGHGLPRPVVRRAPRSSPCSPRPASACRNWPGSAATPTTQPVVIWTCKPARSVDSAERPDMCGGRPTVDAQTRRAERRLAQLGDPSHAHGACRGGTRGAAADDLAGALLAQRAQVDGSPSDGHPAAAATVPNCGWLRMLGPEGRSKIISLVRTLSQPLTASSTTWLDDPGHDPAVLADLAVTDEPELLIGRQGAVVEEAGGH
jgi:hypothetical protein